jgi:cytochrome P450
VSDFDFDPFNPAYWENPYPSYQVMRAEYPVYRHETPYGRVSSHYWMLSRAADVNAALSDWRRFSSSRGVLVDTDLTGVSDSPPLLFDADPPRHDEIRSVLSRVLTQSRVTGLEPHVRRYAEELVAGFRATGSFDASTDFGQLIPTITMCALLDLPVAEHEQFLKWNLDTLGGQDFASESAQRAWSEMGEYWKDVVRERRARPGNDLISQILLVQAEGSVAISDQEVSAFCGLLHDAAQNTTMNMITLAAVTLARFPDQRRYLADRPEIWPQALEELLRYVSPVQGLARNTTTDVTLHDVTIPAGDQVLLLFGSANHDERAFENPEVMDFEREVGLHWTFGHGIHHCLGSAVAKLETRVAVQVLLEELRDWDVDEAAIERSQLVPTRGIAHAPARCAAGPRR